MEGGRKKRFIHFRNKRRALNANNKSGGRRGRSVTQGNHQESILLRRPRKFPQRSKSNEEQLKMVYDSTDYYG